MKKKCFLMLSAAFVFNMSCNVNTDLDETKNYNEIIEAYSDIGNADEHWDRIIDVSDLGIKFDSYQTIQKVTHRGGLAQSYTYPAVTSMSQEQITAIIQDRVDSAMGLGLIKVEAARNQMVLFYPERNVTSRLIFKGLQGNINPTWFEVVQADSQGKYPGFIDIYGYNLLPSNPSVIYVPASGGIASIGVNVAVSPANIERMIKDELNRGGVNYITPTYAGSSLYLTFDANRDNSSRFMKVQGGSRTVMIEQYGN